MDLIILITLDVEEREIPVHKCIAIKIKYSLNYFPKYIFRLYMIWCMTKHGIWDPKYILIFASFMHLHTGKLVYELYFTLTLDVTFRHAGAHQFGL